VKKAEVRRKSRLFFAVIEYVSVFVQYRRRYWVSAYSLHEHCISAFNLDNLITVIGLRATGILVRMPIAGAHINKKTMLSQAEPRDAKFRCIEFYNKSIMERLYAKHGKLATLSTRTHLPPKPTQNTLNHV